MTALEPVLNRLGLAQYAESFLVEGFETWETVLDITEADLDALGVKRGHRRKLQREIANTRGISSDQALRPSRVATQSEDRSTDGEDGSIHGDAKQATGSGGKRKYRRHPKPDENAPERPPSAYVIFSNRVRESLKGQSLSFTEIAKLVGEKWQELDPDEKAPYESQAALAKEKYRAQMADYKSTDGYKEYVQYLADFKARYSTTQSCESARAPVTDDPMLIVVHDTAEGKRLKYESPTNTPHHAAAASESPSSLHSAPASATLPLGRTRMGSVGPMTAYSGPTGQVSPVLHARNMFAPSKQSSPVSPTSASRSADNKPTSPVGLPTYRDPILNTTSQPLTSPTATPDYRNGSEPSPRFPTHLTRLSSMDCPPDRLGPINLPPIHGDASSSGARYVPSMDGRRSQNSASTLQRQGSSVFSTSSGTSLGTASNASLSTGTASSVSTGNGHSSSSSNSRSVDNIPYARTISMAPPGLSRHDGSPPFGGDVNRTTATAGAQNGIGFPTNQSSPSQSPPYPQTGSTTPSTGEKDSSLSHVRIFPADQIAPSGPLSLDHQLFLHQNRHMKHRGDATPAPAPVPAPSPTDDQNNAQRSGGLDASPFSVLLSAGERIAARDAQKPP
ncbi:MAG: hypothetical protein M1825_000253 [Sarcosagium campestre]|nr:MAG: hypothetical protein M1825_000253 [Sarcosagium campestre]